MLHSGLVSTLEKLLDDALLVSQEVAKEDVVKVQVDDAAEVD